MGVKVYFKPLNNLFWADNGTNLTKSGYFDGEDTPIWIVDSALAADPAVAANTGAINSAAQTIVANDPISYTDANINWPAGGFGRTSSDAADKASFHYEIVRNWLSQTFANPTINPFGESINAHYVRSGVNGVRTGLLVYFGNQAGKDFAPAYWNGNDATDETVQSAIHSYWTAPQGAVEVSEGMNWDLQSKTAGGNSFVSAVGNTVIHLGVLGLNGQMTVGSDGTASAVANLTTAPGASLVLHMVAKLGVAAGVILDANYVSTTGGFKLDVDNGELKIGATDEVLAWTPDVGVWHVYTIAFDADADQARLYIDGVLIASSANPGSGAHNLGTDPVAIFSDIANGQLQAGEIADIVIYAGASTPWANIQKDFAAQAIACASYKYALDLLFATNL